MRKSSQTVTVHTTPQNGYAAVSNAAFGWIYPFDENGNQSPIDGGKTDLSMLVSAPYLLMDGMNEKGVIISVLTVSGGGTAQDDKCKYSIQTTTAMRLVLDKAASVSEAVNLLKLYNMNAVLNVRGHRRISTFS